MPYVTVFDMIFEKFGKEKIDYILVGGFAVNAYGVSRHTGDIDFLISDDDYSKVKKMLLELGYRENMKEVLFARFVSDDPKLWDLDLLLVDRQTLKGIYRNGKSTQVSGHSFIVPSLDHLIALKLHAIKNNPAGREFKDMPDIIQLIKMNKIDPSAHSFKDLCLKYGTQPLYAKIVKLL